MARTRSSDFLERLLQAAMRVFAQKGLSRARMSDVAAEMGVAQGSLYNYVESKEALFYLLVDRGVREEPVDLPEELPIRTPPREALLKRIGEQIGSSFVLAQLDAALKRRKVEDAWAELEGIVRELYQRIEQTREPAAVLERTAIDQPDLFILFFVRTRRRLLERLTNYIKRRTDGGYLQPVPNTATAARFMLETVTFFARHRHGDPDTELNLVGDEAVRETTVQLIVRSLIKPSMQTRRETKKTSAGRKA